MIKLGNLTYQQLQEKFRIKRPWDMIIIFVLNILITIPIFIIAHHNFIELEWAHHVDRILLFLIILVAIQLILRLLRRVTLISVILYLLVLGYGSLFSNYGFKTVFEDYRYMIYTMNDDPNPQD